MLDGIDDTPSNKRHSLPFTDRNSTVHTDSDTEMAEAYAQYINGSLNSYSFTHNTHPSNTWDGPTTGDDGSTTPMLSKNIKSGRKPNKPNNKPAKRTGNKASIYFSNITRRRRRHDDHANGTDTNKDTGDDTDTHDTGDDTNNDTIHNTDEDRANTSANDRKYEQDTDTDTDTDTKQRMHDICPTLVRRPATHSPRTRATSFFCVRTPIQERSLDSDTDSPLGSHTSARSCCQTTVARAVSEGGK
ncbi:hypothetical protein SARC_16037 [Sphaeroforma arctica JP610]|uniref:Uncharacterized protein n=1 Tax=Sphaeroforma arctica JP610 TaxID=667725 RepID=A0A0L0F479_9EUKA|nr:hypothetical protein SARC_16037 [Sphaeroforma arctica JP610]KNC71421.1 hypothetical protein SARC_16037 [Sphaeroforma arctica JP610]|eukprot:XP_014145323.1 hypothetical protein SARC_16037 [Sphaeroforma arctica JP610]